MPAARRREYAAIAGGRWYGPDGPAFAPFNPAIFRWRDRFGLAQLAWATVLSATLWCARGSSACSRRSTDSPPVNRAVFNEQLDRECLARRENTRFAVAMLY